MTPGSSGAPHPATAAFGAHVNPAFVKLLGVFGYGRVLTGASGVTVRDSEGRSYLDLLAGFGSVNLGHNHPALIARLHRFLDDDALNLVHVGPSAAAAELAEALAALAGPPLDIALFSNSGAEAVEAGLKLARAATGRSAFVSLAAGFHGTNLGTLSILGSPRMRKPFEPLLADCAQVPFGDAAALENALKARRVAAFVVEPILAEGGVLIPPAGYLSDAQALCKRHGTLLILDEVQTGLGRTGTTFAFQGEGFVPDVLVLAKALGGSLASIGATLTSRESHQRAYGSMKSFDLHGSTFGGNSLACVAALETLRILRDEGLVENARDRGRDLREALAIRLKGHPFVRDVRGRGLLVGVELGPTDAGFLNRIAPSLVEGLAELVFGQWAAVKLLEKGILCQPASQRWNVLKLTPPLTIGRGDVTRAVAAIGEVLDDYREVSALLVDVARRLGEQALSGGAFR